MVCAHRFYFYNPQRLYTYISFYHVTIWLDIQQQPIPSSQETFYLVEYKVHQWYKEWYALNKIPWIRSKLNQNTITFQ